MNQDRPDVSLDLEVAGPDAACPWRALGGAGGCDLLLFSLELNRGQMCLWVWKQVAEDPLAPAAWFL